MEFMLGGAGSCPGFALSRDRGSVMCTVGSSYARRCRLLYRYVRWRLRQASVEFFSVDSRWGFVLPGIVNERTGSEFHSPVEAFEILSKMRN